MRRTMTRHNIYRRQPALVTALLDYIDAGEGEPVPWTDILDDFATGDIAARTIENILYDLTTFGAIRRTGNTATRGRADTRAVTVTHLGAAWFHNDAPPPPLAAQIDEERPLGDE